MGRYYSQSESKFINVSELLLWPDNPRLKFENFKNYKLTPEQLVDDKTQSSLLKYLQNAEHNLDKLIQSIEVNGFRSHEPLIVVFVREINKYYVIEGNRRLASVKTINSKNGSRDILSLPCCEFKYLNNGVDFDSAVNLCVAENHYLGGKKDHSGIQKAKVIFEIYWTFLNEGTSIPRFRLDSKIIEKTAEFLGGLSANEVKKEISIARIYDQLIDAGFKVDHRRRERLSWAIEHPDIFYKQFGFKIDDSLRLSNSLEDYYSLFLSEHCPVSNPTKLKQWLFVLKHKDFNQRHIDLMIHNPAALHNIYLQFKGWSPGDLFDHGDDGPPNLPRKGIKRELLKILKQLQKIKIDDYANSKDEDSVIEDLKKIINDKFSRLLREDLSNKPLQPGLPVKPDTTKPPKGPATIDDILGASS